MSSSNVDQSSPHAEIRGKLDYSVKKNYGKFKFEKKPGDESDNSPDRGSVGSVDVDLN